MLKNLQVECLENAKITPLLLIVSIQTHAETSCAKTSPLLQLPKSTRFFRRMATPPARAVRVLEGGSVSSGLLVASWREAVQFFDLREFPVELEISSSTLVPGSNLPDVIQIMLF